MQKSDLLLPDLITTQKATIEELKNWIIDAATGNIEFPDAEALNHLFSLNLLQDRLANLQLNIEAGAVKFNIER